MLSSIELVISDCMARYNGVTYLIGTDWVRTWGGRGNRRNIIWVTGPGICLERLMNTTKNIRIACVLAEIRNGHLQNTSLKHCCLIQLDSWFDSRQRQNVFSLHSFQNVSGAHPDSYPKGTRGSLLRGVKRARPEANHLLPTGAWSCTSTPSIRLRVTIQKNGGGGTR
jgi:hypothetical protein